MENEKRVVNWRELLGEKEIINMGTDVAHQLDALHDLFPYTEAVSDGTLSYFYRWNSLTVWLAEEGCGRGLMSEDESHHASRVLQWAFASQEERLNSQLSYAVC